MKKKSKDPDFICHYHQDILSILEELKLSPNLEMCDIDKINECIELTEKAYKGGQKMEDRLTCYKYGIESLGFFRDGRYSKRIIQCPYCFKSIPKMSENDSN
jgi:hypothetical protein